MTHQTPARTRFAPSPTGYLHVGGARTALYSYLLARQTGGQFIIRIEDTDQARYKPDSLANFFKAFQFLGLDWDEGPQVGGDYGPYIQSQRREIYHHYMTPLLEKGLVYRCFATAEELQAANEERKRAGLSPGYDRRYRDYDPVEAEKRAAAGEPHVIRLKIPLDGSITVKDFLRGDITVENSNLQDIVLIKSDGLPTYAFAAMLDDHLMKITHVVRDEQWISSFPLHMHVINALGIEPPLFIHAPIILNPSGKGKMSKREGRAPDGSHLPVFIHGFQKMGYLPEAMVNFMALVGWSYDDKTEIMRLDELIKRFRIERINTTPAAWDYNKLNHFNGIYMRNESVESLTDRLLPYLVEENIQANRETLLKITPLIQERLTVLSEAPAMVAFFFKQEGLSYDRPSLVPKKMQAADVGPILHKAAVILSEADFEEEVLESAIKQATKDLGIKIGQMFQPLRVAVSGQKGGPPLFAILVILGRELVLKRIEQAIAKLEA